MKPSEIRTKSKDELAQLLEEKRYQLDNLQFIMGQKNTKNVKERAAIKKDVARILTILHEHA